mmetsp:Transcript_120563/g.384948  ORF Transcript_120563/g.384948 Transcript_120563/m.384948 type:complete len:378 (-) Transcript_120563:1676-2809(-)
MGSEVRDELCLCRTNACVSSSLSTAASSTSSSPSNVASAPAPAGPAIPRPECLSVAPPGLVPNWRRLVPTRRRLGPTRGRVLPSVGSRAPVGVVLRPRAPSEARRHKTPGRRPRRLRGREQLQRRPGDGAAAAGRGGALRGRRVAGLAAVLVPRLVSSLAAQFPGLAPRSRVRNCEERHLELLGRNLLSGLRNELVDGRGLVDLDRALFPNNARNCRGRFVGQPLGLARAVLGDPATVRAVSGAARCCHRRSGSPGLGYGRRGRIRSLLLIVAHTNTHCKRVHVCVREGLLHCQGEARAELGQNGLLSVRSRPRKAQGSAGTAQGAESARGPALGVRASQHQGRALKFGLEALQAPSQGGQDVGSQRAAHALLDPLG